MNWLDNHIQSNLKQAAGRYSAPLDGRIRLLQAARRARKQPAQRSNPISSTFNPYGIHEGRRFSWTIRVTYWMMDTGVIL